MMIMDATESVPGGPIGPELGSQMTMTNDCLGPEPLFFVDPADVLVSEQLARLIHGIRPVSYVSLLSY